jgi:hypothetical protein
MPNEVYQCMGPIDGVAEITDEPNSSSSKRVTDFTPMTAENLFP